MTTDSEEEEPTMKTPGALTSTQTPRVIIENNKEKENGT